MANAKYTSIGPKKLAQLSTSAGQTSSWEPLPGAWRRYGAAVVLGGSTGTITGNVLIQGRLSTGGSATTIITWSSTLGSGGISASTGVPITAFRASSTGLASTASTGSVAITADVHFVVLP